MHSRINGCVALVVLLAMDSYGQNKKKPVAEDDVDVTCAKCDDPGTGQSSCAVYLQGRVAWDYDGHKNWNPENIRRLCSGTSKPLQPAVCFNRVMHSGINWGGGTRWEWKNALDLCAGTENSAKTISCFQDRISSGAHWSDAIRACKK